MTPRIAVDAMGGDDAPGVIVEGAAKAAERLGVEILLVGRIADIEPHLEKVDPTLPIRLVDAPDVIEMADAWVTAGNTGAAMAAALLGLGRVKGIGRPVLGTVFPTGDQSREMLLDIGANAEGRPVHMVQFAHMGSAYMRLVYGVERPRVGLLSNGSEETKGNALVQETHGLLRESGLNFVGNVEATDLARPTVDVVVMDGFTGNVLLKSAEAMAELLTTELRGAFTRTPWNRLAALVLYSDLRKVRRRIDYTEYGGAQLLGVEGITVIGHGRSNARAMLSAIRAARECVRLGVLDVVREIGRDMPAKRANHARAESE